MESIIPCTPDAIQNCVVSLDLTLLPSRMRGRLWLAPETFLRAIHAPTLAAWALDLARRLRPPTLPRGPGGRPARYRDESVLLLAVVQTAWRMSYSEVVDYLAAHEALADTIGCPARQLDGTRRTISQSQYWERRAALGVLPFVLFFLALVGMLIRVGLISGRELVVDSTRLRAWWHHDEGASWSRCRGKATIWGYKVHTVLCRQLGLPVLVVVTPAHVHDSLIGLLAVLLAATLFGLAVAVVYADAAYFDRRFLGAVTRILHARSAVDYNPRRKGKRQLASRSFMRYWRHAVLGPRAVIERHFAWVKRYFGLKWFQCGTYTRVYQFVLLTYCCVVAVALAAHRYQRPDLIHQRSAVLAVKTL
jgi:DDE family transposase